VEHASTTKSQFLAIKIMSNNPSGSKTAKKDNGENRNSFHFGGFCHPNINCRELKDDKEKSVVTESMGSLVAAVRDFQFYRQ
jgi:hypothetical protein